MGFQIHSAEDIPQHINSLDTEAAEFWGKPVDKTEYANPEPPQREGEHELDYLRRSMSSNWFDVIGHQIDSPSSNWTSGWNNVKASLWQVQATSLYAHLFNPEKVGDTDTFAISIEGIRAFLKPYFELIDHWEAKGYKPVQIK